MVPLYCYFYLLYGLDLQTKVCFRYRINKFYVFVLKFDEFYMDTLTMETIGPNIRHSKFNFNGKPYNFVTSPCNNRLYTMLSAMLVCVEYYWRGRRLVPLVRIDSHKTGTLSLFVPVLEMWRPLVNCSRISCCQGRSSSSHHSHTRTSPPGDRYCNR